ncbi:hypothetical protein D3C84_698300 [compost metagenome]
MLTIDDRQAYQLSRYYRQPFKDRLSNINHSAGTQEAQSQGWQLHGQGEFTSSFVLADVALLDQIREQPVYGRDRQIENSRKFRERHALRRVGKLFQNTKDAFSNGAHRLSTSKRLQGRNWQLTHYSENSFQNANCFHFSLFQFLFGSVMPADFVLTVTIAGCRNGQPGFLLLLQKHFSCPSEMSLHLNSGG